MGLSARREAARHGLATFAGFVVAGTIPLPAYLITELPWLSGGSRPAWCGLEFSRNLRPNSELHGEWTPVRATPTSIVGPTGTILNVHRPSTNVVIGVRYPSAMNTTAIVDYFHNGGGSSVFDDWPSFRAAGLSAAVAWSPKRST